VSATAVALIPARGGSRRVPRKNVLPFFGHPLIAYTIAAARNSGLFSAVVVSTEDQEIAAIARRYGAEVLPRPAALADDKTGVVDVALHALEALRARGAAPAALCNLMPNCPLRRSGDIREQFARFEQEGRLFQISAVEFRGVYPHWSLAVDGQGRGRWFLDGNLRRSQDLPPLVCPTGAIWWARAGALEKQRQFYGEPFHVALMDGNRGLDIDTPEDLAFADLLVRGLRDRDGADPLEPVDGPAPNLVEERVEQTR
jgi:pseudaminic acid cytidylyltransferase